MAAGAGIGAVGALHALRVVIECARAAGGGLRGLILQWLHRLQLLHRLQWLHQQVVQNVAAGAGIGAVGALHALRVVIECARAAGSGLHGLILQWLHRLQLLHRLEWLHRQPQNVHSHSQFDGVQVARGMGRPSTSG